MLRVNPDVEAGTHAKISTGMKANKFGVPIDAAAGIFARLSAGRRPQPARRRDPYRQPADQPRPARGGLLPGSAQLVAELRAAGHTITHVDLGGGLGVPYQPGDNPPSPAEWGAMVARVTRDWDVNLMFEPGRLICANAGVLLTEVVWVKPGGDGVPYVIVDAAMNDLARPAMYDAWHGFDAVRPTGETMTANIAGPICETSDTFARDREIDVVKRGDLAVFR